MTLISGLILTGISCSTALAFAPGARGEFWGPAGLLYLAPPGLAAALVVNIASAVREQAKDDVLRETEEQATKDAIERSEGATDERQQLLSAVGRADERLDALVRRDEETRALLLASTTPVPKRRSLWAALLRRD